MYPVSKEYQKAISESSRSFFWTGMITTKQGKKYIFENKDMPSSAEYTEPSSISDEPEHCLLI